LTELYDEFSPETAVAVDGLMWLGHLEDEVKFGGHTFLLRTLKIAEELEAAVIAKEYLETFGQTKATAAAHVAAALTSVDGDDSFCPPIGPDAKQHLRAKFNYVTENWYWPLTEHLFGKYVDLVRRQADAIEAVENLSPGNRKNSWKLADSYKKPEDSESQTDSTESYGTISPEQMKLLADENE